MSKARQSTRKRYRKPRADYQAGGRVKAYSGWYPGKRIVNKMKGKNKGDSDSSPGANQATVDPAKTGDEVRGQGMGESAEAVADTAITSTPDFTASVFIDIYLLSFVLC